MIFYRSRGRGRGDANSMIVIFCLLWSTTGVIVVTAVQARFVVDASVSISTTTPSRRRRGRPKQQQQQLQLLLLPQRYSDQLHRMSAGRSKSNYQCHDNINNNRGNASSTSLSRHNLWKEKRRGKLYIRGGASDTIKNDKDSDGDSSHPSRPSMVASDLMAKARQELAASKARVSSTIVTKEDNGQPKQQLASSQHHQWPSSLHANTAAASVLSSYSSSLTPLWAFYLWTLVGTSVVWHLFFYLLSVGYAVGIGLPIFVAVLQSRRLTVPAMATLLWSVRLAGFLLWREYRAWPAWHARMKAVQQQQESLTSHKLVTLLSWVTYSGIYACLSLPVILGVRDYPCRSPVIPRTLTNALQFGGLLLESIADWQKSMSKRRNPHAWCHVGVWQFSTHPNYLGEGLFWWGTVLSGLTRPRSRSEFSGSVVVDWFTTLAMLVGLTFITTVLRGAVLTLDAAQRRKYAGVPAFGEYQANVGVFGPKHHVYAGPVRDWLAARRERRLVRRAITLDDQVEDSNTTTARIDESGIPR